MPSFQVEQWLRQGISAAKAGDVERAYELLLKVVDVDEYNEQAWMWLSSVAENDADREVCLENVLAINPDNKLAKAGLVHLRTTTTPPPPPLEPELEEDLSPPVAEESLEALQSDWWDEPATMEPTAQADYASEERLSTAAGPAVEAAPAATARKTPVAKRRRRSVSSSVSSFAIALLLVLGLAAAGVAVAAARQVGPFDPTKRDYANAMHPLLSEYEAWWQGSQGILIDELNSPCGPRADGWRNRDILVACSTYASEDCALLAAQCEVDVEAMREQIDEMSQEVQETGAALLAAFGAISAPDDIAVAHTRFLACLRAQVAHAGRVSALARSEKPVDLDYPPACQMFPNAEAEMQAYVINQ